MVVEGWIRYGSRRGVQTRLRGRRDGDARKRVAKVRGENTVHQRPCW